MLPFFAPSREIYENEPSNATKGKSPVGLVRMDGDRIAMHVGRIARKENPGNTLVTVNT